MNESRPQLFASYASIDRARVEYIAASLSAARMHVWMDSSAIPGGAAYGPEIVTAIRGCTAVLLFCSPAAFASRNVRQEIALAWKHERPIVPLLLEPAEIPDELSYWLEATQWIELLDRPDSEWLPRVERSLRELGISFDSPMPNTPVEIRLPTPLTALLGREDELKQIAQLLANHRLVTLVGPGGTGKTRLAIEAARQTAARFPDGVAFVDLSSLRDSGLVLPAIAQALGVRESAAIALPDALATAIAARRILLLLDNCEQVVASAEEMAVLLVRCAGLAVIATSRSALSIRGEQLLPVGPLPVPRVDEGVTLEELAASPAIALFADRAHEASPAFVLTAENVVEVTQICARLDGLPLAIELAAVRTRLLSPGALLTRLERILPALSDGPRDMPARHRTLRDAIDWSHNLLSPSEQVLFRRLAVFEGGWGPEAALAVCDPGGTVDIVECAGSLVDKSLVVLDQTGDRQRFRMLESIREYARDRLDEAGEVDSIRRSHAVYFADFVDAVARPARYANAPTELFGQIDAEYGNVNAVLDFAYASGEATLLARVSTGMGEYWMDFARMSEGRVWLDRAVSHCESAPESLRAVVLRVAGWMARFQGDLVPAEDLARRSLGLSRELGDKRLIFESLTLLGYVAEDRRAFAESRAMHEEALTFARSIDDTHATAWALRNSGWLALLEGDQDSAQQQLEDAVLLARGAGIVLVAAVALSDLGELALRQGDISRAASLYKERLYLQGEVGWHLRWVLEGLAEIAIANGEFERATRLFGAAEVLRERLGIALVPSARSAMDGKMTAVTSALGADDFAIQWQVGRSMTLAEARAEAARVCSQH